MPSRKSSSSSSLSRKQKTKISKKEELLLQNELGRAEQRLGETSKTLIKDLDKFTNHIQKTIRINTKIQNDISSLIKEKKGDTRQTLENIKKLLEESNVSNQAFLQRFNYDTNSLIDDMLTEKEAILEAKQLHKKTIQDYIFLPYKSEFREKIRLEYIIKMRDIAERADLTIKELLEISGLFRKGVRKDANSQEEVNLINSLLKGCEQIELLKEDTIINGILIAKFDETRGYISDDYKSNIEIESKLRKNIARSAIGFGESLSIISFTLDRNPKIHGSAKRFYRKVNGARGGRTLYALVSFSTNEANKKEEESLEVVIKELNQNWQDRKEIIKKYYRYFFQYN